MRSVQEKQKIPLYNEGVIGLVRKEKEVENESNKK